MMSLETPLQAPNGCPAKKNFCYTSPSAINYHSQLNHGVRDAAESGSSMCLQTSPSFQGTLCLK